ncbi:dihydrodipicolinate synthase family protein [Jannaschia aquimarina]|uniref:DapA_2 protein n=1 Tax=Jannaschia aquimarina TaxID=935700 RepID=A0A0D1EPJ3_9RHOB|nr:dihydrodipicolinate synthase family protein [Jannaschia aquimarina]KIT17580.1 4-hydroxy-tetrahydrodipicolinate synthase [Jannaschia aquimarina]SNS72294.1 4-hydroxy-tetrahydrodipicolinate synthase [Jannaschia aquimarina]
MKARRGVYAAAITPLGPDGRPDTGKLVAYCKRLIADGLDGVAPVGTTSEGNSTPMDWRLRLPEALAEGGIAGDRVILGTGACAMDDAAALSKAALDAGFPNVLVLPPFYYKNVSDEGLFAAYARLIERVGSDALRVYLYHFPQMSQTPISVALVQRLKAAFGPVIAGLKDSSGDYAGSLAFAEAADDFDVFPSNEGVLVDALARGCGGVISATTQVAPGLVRRTLEASGADRDRLQALLTEVRKAVSAYQLMAAVKEVEALRSGDPAWRAVLPPLVSLTEAQRAGLARDLAALPAEAGIATQIEPA